MPYLDSKSNSPGNIYVLYDDMRLMYYICAGGDYMLFTVKEVSEIIKTNPTYVYKLIKSKKLPAIKIGAYKVRKEALETFLETYEGWDITDPEDAKSL